jgi:hypothetical protein
MNVKKVLKNMLKNTYVLYGVLFIAVMNVLGYMTHQNYEAVILFALVGFLTQYFSKNMIIILLAPIIFTAVFIVLRQNVREGLADKSPTGKTGSTKTDLKKPSCDARTTKTACGTEDCTWLPEDLEHPTKKGTCSAKAAMTTLHPKWIKDDEKTEQDFYNNLPDDVDDLGISEMTKRTEDLAKNQKNLRDTMTKMMPIMDQAQNMLSNIDTKHMKQMMDMAESVTAPFKRKSQE